MYTTFLSFQGSFLGHNEAAYLFDRKGGRDNPEEWGDSGNNALQRGVG